MMTNIRLYLGTATLIQPGAPRPIFKDAYLEITDAEPVLVIDGTGWQQPLSSAIKDVKKYGRILIDKRAELWWQFPAELVNHAKKVVLHLRKIEVDGELVEVWPNVDWIDLI